MFRYSKRLCSTAGWAHRMNSVFMQDSRLYSAFRIPGQARLQASSAVSWGCWLGFLAGQGCRLGSTARPLAGDPRPPELLTLLLGQMGTLFWHHKRVESLVGLFLVRWPGRMTAIAMIHTLVIVSPIPFFVPS